MELVAWFGLVDLESTSIVLAGDVDQMVKKSTSPFHTHESAQPDLRTLAKACHFVEDDVDYNQLLRDVA